MVQEGLATHLAESRPWYHVYDANCAGMLNVKVTGLWKLPFSLKAWRAEDVR
jgi:hypothetical protein